MELLGADVSTSWFLAITAIVLAYIYSTWTYDHFKKVDVPGPTPWPLIGNLFALWRKGFLRFQCDLHREYGPVFGMFEGRKPVLYIKDTQMLKEIMVKEFASFTNRRSVVLDNPMQNSLFALRDDAWRRVRSQMTPAFSSGKLKQMTEAINDCSDTMVTYMAERSHKPVVDIKTVMTAFTMDVICRTVFGIQVDSQRNPDDPFVKHAKNIFNVKLIMALVATAFPKLMEFLQHTFGVTMVSKETLNFFSHVIDDNIDHRRQTGMTRVDMMQLMIKANEIEPDKHDIDEDNVIGFKYDAGGKGKKGMSKPELMANSVVFFLAGSETTASTLSYLLYSLATNPDIHERLTKEVDDVVGNQTSITPNMLADLEYLDRVIQEVLRMYPIVTRVDRLCSKDVEIKGVKIKKGTLMTISIYAVHHDAHYWPNPEKFDPERFLPEAEGRRDPLTWIPFGFGPRNCIGMRLALMELKIAAVKLLQNFTFQTCEQTQVSLMFKKTTLLHTTQPITLRVERRK